MGMERRAGLYIVGDRLPTGGATDGYLYLPWSAIATTGAFERGMKDEGRSRMECRRSVEDGVESRGRMTG